MKYLNKYQPFFEDRKKSDIFTQAFSTTLEDALLGIVKPSNLNDEDWYAEHESAGYVKLSNRFTDQDIEQSRKIIDDIIALDPNLEGLYTTDLKKLMTGANRAERSKIEQSPSMLWRVEENYESYRRADPLTQKATILFKNPKSKNSQFINGHYRIIITDKYANTLDNKGMYQGDPQPLGEERFFVVIGAGSSSLGNVLAKDYIKEGNLRERQSAKGSEGKEFVSAKCIGSEDGYDTLSEALWQLYTWILVTSLTGKSERYLKNLYNKILFDIDANKMGLLGSGKSLRDIDFQFKQAGTTGEKVENIRKYNMVKPEIKALKPIYELLGLKIDFESLKTTGEYLGSKGTTSEEEIWYVTISTDFHSVPNSFLDIVSRTLYDNKTCEYTDKFWQKQFRGKVEGLERVIKIEDVKGILVNLPNPIHSGKQYTGPAPEKEVTVYTTDEDGRIKKQPVKHRLKTQKLEYDILPLDQNDTIYLILNSILDAFTVNGDKLFIANKEEDDEVGLVNLVREFTSILMRKVESNDEITPAFISSLINESDLYRRMYNVITSKDITDASIKSVSTSTKYGASIQTKLLDTIIPSKNKDLAAKIDSVRKTPTTTTKVLRGLRGKIDD